MCLIELFIIVIRQLIDDYDYFYLIPILFDILSEYDVGIYILYVLNLLRRTPAYSGVRGTLGPGLVHSCMEPK